jgi:hypothetical protein
MQTRIAKIIAKAINTLTFGGDMNFLRKLALASVGLGFILGFAVSNSYGQYRTRSWNGYDSYSRPYIQYRSPYGYRRYNGLSWRERRRLAWQRHRMIRARQRYFRTRARMLNRGGYYSRPGYYYRNW